MRGTTARPSRRVLAFTVAGALALAGLAVAGSASAEGACPTYTDPAGDAVPGDPALDPAVGEPDLDLLAVSHSVDAGSFTSVLKVSALNASGPDFAPGDRFSVNFTVGGKAVVLSVIRDFTGLPTGVEQTSSMSVGGTKQAYAPKVTFDDKASTVTFAVPVEELNKAAATDLAGQPFSAMTATTRSDVAGNTANTVAPLYDTATAPATAKYVFGGSCSGGAPAPVDPTPIPTATADPNVPVLLTQPRKNCRQFTDPTGDASTNPASQAVGDPDDDLDLTSVTYRTSDTALQAYVTEKALSTAPSSIGGIVYDTHSFSTGFTVGGKAIVLTADKTGPATATVGGTASTALHPTATFDTKLSNIVFSVPLADLAALSGAPVGGAALTALTATSTATSSSGPAPSGTADSAAPTTTPQKTYVVGDNTCFLPPPGTFAIDGDSGVYSDASEVFATLVDADGVPVAGAPVTMKLTGLPARTVKTDSDGIADFIFPVTVPAGAKTLDLTFPGSAEVGVTKVSAPFKVEAEKTVLKATGAKGAVTAVLSDNDRSAVANRVVAFTVGKKTTKVKTNGRGQATLGKLAKGTVVKVSFAAVPGYYSAAKPVSAKAR